MKTAQQIIDDWYGKQLEALALMLRQREIEYEMCKKDPITHEPYPDPIESFNAGVTILSQSRDELIKYLTGDKLPLQSASKTIDDWYEEQLKALFTAFRARKDGPEVDPLTHERFPSPLETLADGLDSLNKAREAAVKNSSAGKLVGNKQGPAGTDSMAMTLKKRPILKAGMELN